MRISKKLSIAGLNITFILGIGMKVAYALAAAGFEWAAAVVGGASAIGAALQGDSYVKAQGRVDSEKIKAGVKPPQ